MAMTVPVLAAPTVEEQLQELLQQLNAERVLRESLQQQVWQLQQQLEEERQQQPPAPVFEPLLRLLNPTSITVAPGEVVEVVLSVRNVGIHNALNVMTQATPNGPFTVEFLNNSNIVNSIGENRQHNMTLRITVNENAASGAHSIALNHHFRTQAQANRTGTDTIAVHIVGEGAETDTNLQIRNMVSPTERFRAGQTATISFYVHNTGTTEARNIRVEAAPESITAIVPVDTASTQTIQSLAPGQSQRLTFSFSPREAAVTRSYAIGFTVTHSGESFQQFTSINVYAPGDETEANIEIRSMTAPTGRFNVGQTATISFYVHNTGQAEARNIRVEAVPESTTAIVPVNTSSTQTIQSLAPGQSQRLTFSFSPRDSAITRSYAIGFTVTHGSESIQQFTAINVNNPERDQDTPGAVQIPRVMIANTTITPGIPRAGQNFDMEITFRNTSSNRSVNNIRVLMEEIITTIPGQQTHFAGFNPEGSNTLFIDYLAPQGEITMNLRFSTVMEATPGAHNMRFTFDYQDQDFATHSANQQISISVAQVTRLELTNVTVGDWGTPTVGSPVRFGYRIINSGRVNLINVRTRMEGETPYSMDTTFGGRYIGQINSQRIADFDGTFTPNEPGMQRGVFIVYGEDTTGEIVEIRHEFEIYVEGGWGGGDWGSEGGDWGEGGGRPGMGMPMLPGERQEFWAWCNVAEDMVLTGYIDPDTFEFVSLGEWCMETGEWLPYSTGFDFLAFIRRPLVWGLAAGIAGAALIVVIVVMVRKKGNSRFDADMFDDDM